MALHSHVHNFYHDWLEKADRYNDQELSDCFNKAFSLFTLYNKLYAEATFELSRRDPESIDPLNNHFPDRKGATKYAPKLIGHELLFQVLTSDQACRESLESLIQKISDREFHIKLGMLRGERQAEKDDELVEKLKSMDPVTKVEAVLDLIYSVRCNMLHGNKQFDLVQIDLLEPVNLILRRVIVELYEALNR